MIKAIHDPTFRGLTSFKMYMRIESSSEIQHMIDVVEWVLKDRPKENIDKYECIFYSVPDRQGMRFMRQYQDGGWMSDFRHEWYREVVN